jgi:hypothetical protein
MAVYPDPVSEIPKQQAHDREVSTLATKALKRHPHTSGWVFATGRKS